MIQPLDVFSTESDGTLLWRGSAEDFVAAKRFIESLAASRPGEFLILNQVTGQRQRMQVLSKPRSLKEDVSIGQMDLEPST